MNASQLLNLLIAWDIAGQISGIGYRLSLTSRFLWRRNREVYSNEKASDMGTILVIDDSPTICHIIELTLHRAGYTVICRHDGTTALRWLLSTEVIPDLVFIDIGIPHWDGYIVLQYFRTLPALCNTIFAIISRRDGLIDRLKGRLLGAVFHLVKPFDSQDLLSVVETALGTSRVSSPMMGDISGTHSVKHS